MEKTQKKGPQPRWPRDAAVKTQHIYAKRPRRDAGIRIGDGQHNNASDTPKNIVLAAKFNDTPIQSRNDLRASLSWSVEILKKKHNQHINHIGLDCNFTKTLVYRYDLADLLMSRCEKTKTCLQECHNIKPQKILASPILWGGHVLKNSNISNGMVLSKNFRLKYNATIGIRFKNQTTSSLLTQNIQITKKSWRHLPVSLSVSRFREEKFGFS